MFRVWIDVLSLSLIAAKHAAGSSWWEMIMFKNDSLVLDRSMFLFLNSYNSRRKALGISSLVRKTDGRSTNLIWYWVVHSIDRFALVFHSQRRPNRIQSVQQACLMAIVREVKDWGGSREYYRTLWLAFAFQDECFRNQWVTRRPIELFREPAVNRFLAHLRVLPSHPSYPGRCWQCNRYEASIDVRPHPSESISRATTRLRRRAAELDYRSPWHYRNNDYRHGDGAWRTCLLPWWLALRLNITNPLHLYSSPDHPAPDSFATDRIRGDNFV